MLLAHELRGRVPPAQRRRGRDDGRQLLRLLPLRLRHLAHVLLHQQLHEAPEVHRDAQRGGPRVALGALGALGGEGLGEAPGGHLAGLLVRNVRQVLVQGHGAAFLWPLEAL